jgi:hypothetical protein
VHGVAARVRKVAGCVPWARLPPAPPYSVLTASLAAEAVHLLCTSTHYLTHFPEAAHLLLAQLLEVGGGPLGLLRDQQRHPFAAVARGEARLLQARVRLHGGLDTLVQVEPDLLLREGDVVPG